MTGPQRRARRVPGITTLVAVVSLVLVTSCAAPREVSETAGSSPPDVSVDDTDAAVDKAGSPLPDDPVTLRVAWYGAEGRPQAKVVERFAEEVAKASGGSIKIDISY